MFAALSRFVVANGMADEVRQAFRGRPHLVDEVEGFVRLDVITPVENPDEFWLLTYWTDQESFTRWHRGHTYKSSHAGIPKGLKLVRGETRLSHFTHVTS